MELAVHADIDDENQTVTVKIPEIHTTANINGKKDVTAEKTITVIDIVKYENLTIGKEYNVKGVLMDKSTGKPFMVKGQEVTAEVKFTAETADGEIQMNFTFDGSVIGKDTDIVVFENLGGVVSFLLIKFRKKDEDEE